MMVPPTILDSPSQQMMAATNGLCRPLYNSIITLPTVGVLTMVECLALYNSIITLPTVGVLTMVECLALYNSIITPPYSWCTDNGGVSCTRIGCEQPTRCSAEPDTGPCRGSIPAYYYDPEDAICKMFVWGGCGGNDNKYKTIRDCLQSCNPNSECYSSSRVCVVDHLSIAITSIPLIQCHDFLKETFQMMRFNHNLLGAIICGIFRPCIMGY